VAASAASDEYRRRLLEHIATYRRTAPFPEGAKSGTVMVRFALDRVGSVLTVSVISSSGAAMLDDEAVATIWRAQPMPPIPSPLPQRLSITLPVAFGTLARGQS
jgi:protein TonB